MCKTMNRRIDNEKKKNPSPLRENLRAVKELAMDLGSEKKDCYFPWSRPHLTSKTGLFLINQSLLSAFNRTEAALTVTKKLT